MHVWCLCGARPALTLGATPTRSIGDSASTGFGFPALPVLQCEIPLFFLGLGVLQIPIRSTSDLGSYLHSLYLWVDLCMTFRGRKPTSSSSYSSSTGEFRNLLSVLCKHEFCFIFKRKLRRKGTAVGGGRLDDLAVLDLSRASDEGVVKARG